MPTVVHQENILGNSRFATPLELKKMGLIDNGEGIVLGKVVGNLIEKPPSKAGHLLVVGGNGSGKSASVVIPTLLRWKGAVFCIDVKGELSDLTAEHRPNTYVFDVKEGRNPYNPLAQCKMVEDVMEIARALIPNDTGESFWVDGARNIMAAVLFESAMEGKSLPEALKRIAETPDQELIESLMNSKYDEVKMLSKQGKTAEQTLQGLTSQLSTHILPLATSGIIKNATSYGSWTPQSLEEGASIYLKINERTIEQYAGLWRVIISQVLGHLMDRKEGAETPVLLLLDELPRLGKVEGLLNALATLRSKNVHIVMCVQSMAQLEDKYGQTNTKVIADNSAYKLILKATDVSSQKYFSDLAGMRTVWAGNLGVSEQQVLFGTQNLSKGKSQHSVPLIRPEEFGRLGMTEGILFFPSEISDTNCTRLIKAYWKNTKDIAKVKNIEVDEKKQPIKEIKKLKGVRLGKIKGWLIGLGIAIIGLGYAGLYAYYRLLMYFYTHDTAEHISKYPFETQQALKTISEQRGFNFEVAKILLKTINLGDILTVIGVLAGNFISIILIAYIIKLIFFRKKTTL